MLGYKIRIYYYAKYLIPRKLQIFLRRKLVQAPVRPKRFRMADLRTGERATAGMERLAGRKEICSGSHP